MKKTVPMPKIEKPAPAATDKIKPAKRVPAAEKPAASANVRGTSKRRDQQRAIETRQAILQAALSEFAERGFDAASIRNIGARTGLQHPLITYHYRTKEALWKAVAENIFSQSRRYWDDELPLPEGMSAVEYIRAVYSTIFRFSVTNPDLHNFFLRESRPGSPRLSWLVDTILQPRIKRLIPQIQAAQGEGGLPPGDPVLIHYMLVGMVTVLSSLKGEIHQIAGIKVDDPKVVESYMEMIDAFLFPSTQSKGALPARARGKKG